MCDCVSAWIGLQNPWPLTGNSASETTEAVSSTDIDPSVESEEMNPAADGKTKSAAAADSNSEHDDDVDDTPHCGGRCKSKADKEDEATKDDDDDDDNDSCSDLYPGYCILLPLLQ